MPLVRSGSPPQSNQRGIETPIRLMSPPVAPGSLNRTSVGLKRAQRGSRLQGAGRASIEPAWD